MATAPPVSFQRVGGGAATINDLFGVGIELVDSPGQGAIVGTRDAGNNPTAPGSNLVIITYDAKVLDSVAANSSATTSATLFNYAGSEGGLDHTTVDLTEAAQVVTAPPAINKQIIATDRPYTSQASGHENVVIGEIITYQVTLTVPEGTNANAQFVDTLDRNLSITELVSATSSAGISFTNPLAAFTSVVPTDAGGGSANRITFDFGTITNTNTDNAATETITLVYRAVVSNVVGNQVSVQRTNTAALNSDAGSISTQAPYVVVVEPNIAVSLTPNVTTADAGDTVTFTLTLTSNGGSPAFDVGIADLIPAGMTYIPASLIQTGGPAAISLGVVGAGLSGTWSQIDPGAPVTLSFQVTLDNGVTIGQSLSQTADAEWSSIPGGASNLSPYTTIGDAERTGVDGVGGVNDYVSSGTAAVTVVTPIAPVLTLIQTSEPASSPSNVAVGEILRYRMVMLLPEASAADFRVNPVLPAGLRFLNDGTSTLSFVTDDVAGGITSSTLSGAGLDQTGGGLLPADISAVPARFAIPGSAIVDTSGTPIAAGPMTAGAEPVFRLGDLVNLDRDANREFVVIEFNAVVDNRSGVVNTATQPVQFSYETAGLALGGSNTVTTTVVEPNITSMDKRVLSVSGNQVTYQVTFTNTGTESAQDVRLTDAFGGAVNQNFNGAAAVTLATVPPGTVNNSTAGGLDVSIPVLGIGQSVTVLYTATIPDITVATPARDATVVYSSLTEGAAGGKTLDVITAAGTVSSSTTGERTGDTADYGGALNVYSKLDPAGLGVISGRLWDDTTDFNSLFTGSDTGLNGRTVTLTWAGSDNVFGNGDDQAFTVNTAPDGSYVSGAMPAGSYRITTAASFTDGSLGKLNVFNDGGASGSKVDGLITLTLADAGTVSAQNFIYVQQNDAPVVSVGPARSIIEDVATPFSGADLVSVTDPDAGSSSNNQVIVTVLQGNLSVIGAGTAIIAGNGTASVTITGSLTDINTTLASLNYLNALNYNGADTLTVTINDRGNTGDANGNGVPNEVVGDNLQHVRTVNLTVTGVNDPPVAQNDSRATNEDTTITGQAMTPSAGQQAAGDVTDSDPDTPYGDVISVQGVVAGNVGGVQSANVGAAVVGTYGTLTLGNNGAYSYVPGPAAQALPVGALVNDVFTYTIRDVAGVTSTATISIAITGLNDPVAAAPDIRSLFEDDPPITGNAVRGNGVAGGQPGDVLDPDPDNDTVVVQGAQAGTTAAVLGSGVGVSITGSYGSLVLNADGTYTYSQDSRAQALAAGQIVNDVFSYTVNDAHGTTATTTLTIVMTGRNDPPVAVSDVRSTDQNTPISGQVMSPSPAQQTAGDVTDTDPDLPGGDVLTVQGAAAGVVAGPISGGLGVAGVGGTYGHLNLYPDGTYQYQPGPLAQTLPAGAVVNDVFTYTIRDASGSTSTATITITVNGLNNPVVAVPDIRTTSEDAPPISGNVVTGNGVAGGQPGDAADPDPDSDPLTVGGVQAGTTTALLNSGVGVPILGSYGSLVLNADGTYTYTLDTRAQGLAQGQVVQDVFSYTVGDPGISRATTTLTINISGQNDPPSAINDVRSTDEDTAIAGQLLSPSLAQQTAGDVTDTDPDLINGDVISIQGIAPGVVVGPLAPGAGASGVDGSYGRLTVNNDGSYSYVPGAPARALQAGTVVQDVFTYTIRDLNGATSTALLTITINGLNDAPSANRDANSIVTDAIVPSTGNVIAAGAVTDAPDSDPDGGDVLTVQGVVSGTSLLPTAGGVGVPLAGTYGSLILQPNGSYAYTLDPNNPVVLAMLPGQTLTDVYSYTINDGNGGLATTTLTITIRGVYDPPEGQNKSFVLLEDTAQALTAADFGFSDPDLGDTMQAVRIDTLPASGSLLLNGVPVSAGQIIPFGQLGNLGYLPAINANDQNLPASPQFRFSVQDSSGLFDLVPNTISFLINPVNDPPTAPVLTTTIDASAVLGSSVSNVPGLGAPTDPDVPLQLLTVQINSIPDLSSGTFFLPDRTPVTPGMSLTPAQLQNLSFVPNPANPNPASALNGLVPAGALTFTVLDGNGGAADGVININVRPVPPALTPSGFPPTSNAAAALLPIVQSAPVAGPASSSTSVNSDTPRAGAGEFLRTALANERSNRAVDSLNLAQARAVGEFEPLLVESQADGKSSIAKNSVEEKSDPSKNASAQDCVDTRVKPPAPKPKAVRTNVFASRDGILLQKPKTFSEQLNTAQKRFKPPTKLPLRRDSQSAC